METEGIFKFEIIINVSYSFENLCYGSTAILNIFSSYSAWTDFRCQNLTSTDVRFWRLKSIPGLEGLITATAIFNPFDLLIKSLLLRRNVCSNIKICKYFVSY